MPDKKPRAVLTHWLDDTYTFDVEGRAVRVTRQEALDAELPADLQDSALVTRARHIAVERSIHR